MSLHEMDPTTKILLASSELVSLIFIVRLWGTRHQSKGFFAKLLWTTFLMVPLLGPVFYAFTQDSTEANPYDPREYPDDSGGGHGGH